MVLDPWTAGMISGGKKSFVWPVSGVIRAWGRRQGSQGDLLRSWDHVYVDGGREIPREFHLFDVCPLSIELKSKHAMHPAFMLLVSGTIILQARHPFRVCAC